MAAAGVMGSLSLAVLPEWLATLGLIFGGCCSNAITLEQLTSQYPHAGTSITFFQFLVITLLGLPRQIVFRPISPSASPSSASLLYPLRRIPLPRLRTRRIPIGPYIVQVALFYAVSLLNNAAFAYQIPMAVHIIFRSGGLIVSMVLGRVFGNKQYSRTQVLSVLMVTAGVIVTTLSAAQSTPTPTERSEDETLSTADYSAHRMRYAMGIAILFLALVLSGFLGLMQDWTYATYTRSPTKTPSRTQNGHAQPQEDGQPPWQESMFYLHFLAMPMFWSVRGELAGQLSTFRAGPTLNTQRGLQSFFGAKSRLISPSSDFGLPGWFSVVPAAYVLLVLNTLTQMLCVSGVHRLTSRVSSLTVTLVLVVRKAVSLVISVLFLKGNGGANGMMWLGAALVMIGTIGYSMGGKKGGPRDAKEKTS